MKRFINIGILVSSLLGYMEWGTNQNSFLFEIEYELLFNQKNFIDNITHPLILGSLTGQLLILICIVKNNCSKTMNFIGMALLSCIILLILTAGILSSQIKMIGSTLPFLFFAGMLIYHHKKREA